MKVVITGATSMIGAALTNSCLQNNCEVLAIIRKDSKKEYRIPDSKLLHIVYSDLDELDEVTSYSNNWDVFYHLAWKCTSRQDRDDPICQEENIRTTLDAVNLANRLGCKMFVGAGSQAEYGIVRDVISEETPANPLTAYGIAKLSAGMLSRRMCEQYGIVHVWTRIFSVYGINDTENSMISYAIRSWNAGKKAVFSSGTQMWNFLYEDDAGKMLYLLGAKMVDGGVYCIASDTSQQLKLYIQELAEAYGSGAVYELSKTHNTSQVELRVDIEKTISAIQYKPEMQFENGIRKIVEVKKRKGFGGNTK